MLLLLGLACTEPDEGPRPGRRPAETDTADTGDTGDSGDTADTAAPGCGNDVRESAEECDGTDAEACPGRCASTCQCPSSEASTALELVMIDVWQGDALLVTSPAGFTMLVDSGEEAVAGPLARALRTWAPGGLDYTLVSHQHADHMGGMGVVLTDHPEVGLAWDGGGTATTDAFDDYVAAAGTRRTTIVAGQTLDLGPDLVVEVLHADVGATENENYNSVVLRLTRGDTTLLLGGDCESEGCERFFRPGPIDVYKVHHHGSSDSTAGPMVETMAPSVALISAGAGNDYGHPHAETLDLLAAAGAQVWRTDQDGSVVVTTDGVAVAVEAVGR